LSVQKKKSTRKKQPDNLSTRKKKTKSRAKKKVNGNSYIPWFVGSVVVCALVATWLLLPPIEGGSSPVSFENKRVALNQTLRECLKNLGVDPQTRPVAETRDKITDADFSWDVLNWRVRVSPNFDFPYARLRIEQRIREIGCSHNSLWNFEDESIPLKIEAYAEDRLSHRIFFTIEKEKKNLFTAEYPAEETTELNGNHKPKVNASKAAKSRVASRWDVIKGQRLELDKIIQSVLVRNALNGPPLLVSEYWTSESGADVANWIVSVKPGEDLDYLQEDISNNATMALVKNNFAKVANKTQKVLEIFVADSLSHRVFFTSYQNGAGRRASGEDSDTIVISKPRVAIIIDDIGYDVEAAENLMGMGVPITLSILPHRPHSTELALRAKKKKYEVMLHQPMEPMAYPSVKPGAGAIYSSLSRQEVASITAENIKAVPYAKGVNNHMGSRAMTNNATVQSMLEVIRENGLYFVDSRTIGNTVGYDLARSMEVPAAERSVFIDKSDKADYQYSIGKLRETINRALEQGSCVAIGHPSPETINAIKSMVNKFEEAGVELVFASSLVY
jgi:polysaccharide deacetylase 2 family uncharacterized protein YibQ